MKINLRSFTSLLRSNWPLKVISLAIAIVIWLLVVQYVNPEDTRRLDNIKIELKLEDSVPAGEGLVLVTDYDKSLSISYKASRDVIAMLNTEKISAYVDLSSATKSGEYNFPVKVDTGGQNISIIEQSVTEALLKFEKSATAQIKVDVIAEGTVPDGYVKNDPLCVPSVLNIEGPETKISEIVSAVARVGEKSFTQTNVYNCDYVYVDADGKTVSKDFITADYDKVDITVTVLRSKTLPITATVTNSSGGHDSNYASLSIDPAMITVAGGEDTLDTLNSYDLGTIDVAEQTVDFEQEYIVSLQNGIKNVDGLSTIKVSVHFGDVSKKTISFSSFSIENLAKGQTASIVDKSLEVVFRGNAADLAVLSTDNVRIVADFQNKLYTNGSNNVPIYVDIPDNLKVGTLGKYYLTVKISK